MQEKTGYSALFPYDFISISSDQSRRTQRKAGKYCLRIFFWSTSEMWLLGVRWNMGYLILRLFDRCSTNANF